MYNSANDKTEGFWAEIAKFILFLVSVIYYLAVKVILYAYRANILKIYRLNCKVISVGNLTWGGTGKTPIVELVAKRLSEKVDKVAIQSRGYGGKVYQSMGDEPFMLQENLPGIPVIAGKNRVKEARLALNRLRFDTLILDDGFQHWRLFRDLDIVAIDAANPFGNGFLIPRGILREPVSALNRADIFFLTRVDFAGDNLTEVKQRLTDINPRAVIVESVHSPEGFYDILEQPKKIDTSLLKEKKLGMITAIGNPDYFEKTLLNLGLTISAKFIFPDHHEFSSEELGDTIRFCKQEGITALLTTQKDAVRLRGYCPGLAGIQVLVLRIEIKITENEDGFLNRLFSVYKR